MAGLLWPVPSAADPSAVQLRKAGETATTHRPGDLIVYRFACHDADSLIALAERGGAGDLAAALVLQGKCFQNAGCIAARLEGWIAGPYTPPRGTPGSVARSWRPGKVSVNAHGRRRPCSAVRHPASPTMGKQQR